LAKQSMLIGVPGIMYAQKNVNTSIHSLILNIVERHKHDLATCVNKDLLHAIVEGAKVGSFSSCTPEDFIVDNCTNIYFAGHETTSTTAAWCLMLLASHPKWQSCARAEVLGVCQGNSLNTDMLWKLKTVCLLICRLFTHRT
ncbi:Cytochrome P450 714C2, partial [Dichanthelium oligosanthes]